MLSPWHSIQAVSPFMMRYYTWEWERELMDDFRDGGRAHKYENMARKVGGSENMLQ